MALIYNQAWNIKNYRYAGDVSKIILCIFEQLSGLKLNFQSEIYFFGTAKEVDVDYKLIFGCEAGSFCFVF